MDKKPVEWAWKTTNYHQHVHHAHKCCDLARQTTPSRHQSCTKTGKTHTTRPKPKEDIVCIIKFLWKFCGQHLHPWELREVVNTTNTCSVIDEKLQLCKSSKLWSFIHSFICKSKQSTMTPKTKTTLTRRQRSKERQDASKGRKSWTDSCHPHQTRKWSWRGKDWKRQAACEWSADEEFMKLTVSHQELEEGGKLKVLKQLQGKVVNVKFNDVVTIVRCRKTGRGAGVLSCTQEETRRKVERIALIKEDRKKRKMQEWFVQSGEKQEVSFEWFVLQLDPMKENSSLWPPDVQILHKKINKFECFISF